MSSACLNFREVGFRPDSPGGFGEYMILEEAYTHVIPDDWSDELGIFVENFNVGYWGVWGNGCNPDASDDCAIIGRRPDRLLGGHGFARLPAQMSSSLTR